jgi:carboxylesterase type B
MTATVSTRSGKLEGDDEGGLFVFKGSPFAAAPIGKHRWLAPEKGSWSGVRDARSFGAVSHQNAVINGALAAMVINENKRGDSLPPRRHAPGRRAYP